MDKCVDKKVSRWIHKGWKDRKIRDRRMNGWVGEDEYRTDLRALHVRIVSFLTLYEIGSW